MLLLRSFYFPSDSASLHQKECYTSTEKSILSSPLRSDDVHFSWGACSAMAQCSASLHTVRKREKEKGEVKVFGLVVCHWWPVPGGGSNSLGSTISTYGLCLRSKALGLLWSATYRVGCRRQSVLRNWFSGFSRQLSRVSRRWLVHSLPVVSPHPALWFIASGVTSFTFHSYNIPCVHG